MFRVFLGVIRVWSGRGYVLRIFGVWMEREREGFVRRDFRCVEFSLGAESLCNLG